MRWSGAATIALMVTAVASGCGRTSKVATVVAVPSAEITDASPRQPEPMRLEDGDECLRSEGRMFVRRGDRVGALAGREVTAWRVFPTLSNAKRNWGVYGNELVYMVDGPPNERFRFASVSDGHEVGEAKLDWSEGIDLELRERVPLARDQGRYGPLPGYEEPHSGCFANYVRLSAGGRGVLETGPLVHFCGAEAIDVDGDGTFFAHATGELAFGSSGHPWGMYLFTSDKKKSPPMPTKLATLATGASVRVGAIALTKATVVLALESAIVEVPKTGGAPRELMRMAKAPTEIFVDHDVPFAVVGAEVWEVAPATRVVVHATDPIITAARLVDGTWAWCTSKALFTDR